MKTLFYLMLFFINFNCFSQTITIDTAAIKEYYEWGNYFVEKYYEWEQPIPKKNIFSPEIFIIIDTLKMKEDFFLKNEYYPYLEEGKFGYYINEIFGSNVMADLFTLILNTNFFDKKLMEEWFYLTNEDFYVTNNGEKIHFEGGEPIRKYTEKLKKSYYYIVLSCFEIKYDDERDFIPIFSYILANAEDENFKQSIINKNFIIDYSYIITLDDKKYLYMTFIY